ncbi:NACHT and WD repeat domain-containing protein [Actinoplanes sp. NPDC020271]|uniref:NACHT and WD repeat domain-containing protein n=1 Tax=Actinoplanes sp. NPDC020271 TaxID=3363896 RepID=UPI003793282C
MHDPDLPDTSEPADRARAGVRAWVRETGRRARARARGASPYAILAFLTASAVAPVAGAGLGVSAEFAVALAQLGGLGSNFLADSLAGTAQRLRGTAPVTEQQWRDAVAADLLPLLDAGDERSRQLQAEVSAVLHEVDAVATALTEAAEADEDLRRQLEQVFEELGSDVGELRWMVGDVHRAVDGLRQQFAGQTFLLHQQLEQVRRQLVAVTREPLPPSPGPRSTVSPYPGLAAFEPADAPLFRGREAQVAELLGRLSEQVVGGPALVVTGVSGVGKSSLLRAGLLPAIGAGRSGPEAATWPWVLLTPGPTPLRDLVQEVAALVPDGSAAMPELVDDVRRQPERLGTLTGQAEAAGRRPIIVVDQFEELFTQCADPAERLAFASALTAASPALVVIAVRSDFYPACIELPPLAGLLAAGHVVLGPLDAEALRRVVIEPAEQAGLKVDPGLPELLLRDLGQDPLDDAAATGGGYQPGALPLLAHALRATWERRDDDRLTVEAYRKTGGIRYAVAETAERIYLGLTPEDREALRAALLSLVTVTSTGTVVRRRGERSAGNTAVLDRLVAERLVTAGAETVEISHEALLTGWPRLAGWVEEARADLDLRQRVVEAAEDWDRSGHDPDLLLRGSRLLAARERLTDASALPAPAPDFLAAGTEAAERDELARRRTTGRLRRLAAGLGVALLLAVAGGLVAVDKQRVAAEKEQEAQESRRDAASRQHAAEAINALDRDEITAVRQALAGWQEKPTVEARGALLSAQMVNALGTLGTEPGGTSVGISPDATRIAVAHEDGTVRLWDAATYQPVGKPLVPPDEKARENTAAVAFSPDGRFLLSSTVAYNGVHIWDAATGQLVRVLPGGAAAAWLPGTSTVIATRTDTTGNEFQLGFWDATTGRLARSVPIGDYFALDLSVSRDGRFVAATKDRKSPGRVWQVDGWRLVTTVADTAFVAFAPDGSLVGSNALGQLTQWAIPSGKKVRTMVPDVVPAGAGRIAITSDGVVVANNGNRTVGLFSLADGSKTIHDTGVGTAPAVAVSPDGRLVAVTGADAPTAMLRRATTWLPHVGRVTASAFSPDGRQLATAADDGLVRVWDTATRNLVTSIRTSGAPAVVAYAAGGTLVDVTADRQLEVRDAATGNLRETVPLAGIETDLAVSPDGSLLAVSTGLTADEIFAAGSHLAEAEQKASKILVYDVVQREARASFWPGRNPYTVAFSADGATLLATVTANGSGTGSYAWASDLRRWRVSDFSEQPGAALGNTMPLDLAVSPADGSIAVAGTSGFVEIRSPDGANVRWRTDPQIQQIDGIAFAPDGRTLATTEFNGRVHLWDAGARRPDAVLTGHRDRSGSLSFSPDGKLLASSGSDWTFGLWRLDEADVITDLCWIAATASRTDGRPLSTLCR